MTMEHVKWLKLLCKDLQRTIYIAHMIGHTKIVIWISSSSKLKVKLYNYMNMEHVHEYGTCHMNKSYGLNYRVNFFRGFRIFHR